MHRDCRIDQIAAQRSQPGKRAIFVCAGKPAISDDVCRKYRREFPGLGHNLFATSRNTTVSFCRANNAQDITPQCRVLGPNSQCLRAIG